MKPSRFAFVVALSFSALAGALIGGSAAHAQGSPGVELTISGMTSATQVPLWAPCTTSCFAQMSTIKAFVGGSSGTNVNSVLLNGAATGSPPSITPGGTGSDTNIGIILAPKGNLQACLGGTTLANASLCSPTVANAVNEIVVSGAATGSLPTIVTGGTSADTNRGMQLSPNGTGSIYLGGTTIANSSLTVGTVASAVNGFVLTPAATGNTPGFLAGGSSADAAVAVAFGTNGTGLIQFVTDFNVTQFAVGRTASAVNNLQVAGSTGTAPPTIAPVGTGATLGMQLQAKSTGAIFVGGTTTANASLQVATVASAVNQVVVTPAATGTAPTIVTGGSGVDTNRNLNLAGSGTGIVTLGTTGGTGGLSCTDSGNGTRTCNGQRGIATFTATTIAGVTNSAQTINNSSVTTSSLVSCWLATFSGTIVTNGIPVVTTCVAGTGTITANITNVHATQTTGSQSFGVGFVVLN